MGRAAEFGAGHAQVPARIGMKGFILRCEQVEQREAVVP